MKKIISALKGATLIALISFNHAAGQDVVSNTNKFPELNHFPASDITGKTSAAAEASVSKRAIKDFVHSYPNKVQPVWAQSASGGYTASFAEADIKNCVYYDKKGNRICDIKQYGESKMSLEIRRIMKPVYYDYKINGIAEIAMSGKIVHLLYLQDANNFKTVRIDDGIMDVIEWIKDGKFVSL